MTFAASANVASFSAGASISLAARLARFLVRLRVNRGGGRRHASICPWRPSPIWRDGSEGARMKRPAIASAHALGWQMHPLRQWSAPARRRQPGDRERRLDHGRGLGQHAQLARPGRRLPQGRQLHPLQLQRRLLLVSLRPRQPAAARHRRRTGERELGLYRRHLRQGRRPE